VAGHFLSSEYIHSHRMLRAHSHVSAHVLAYFVLLCPTAQNISTFPDTRLQPPVAAGMAPALQWLKAATCEPRRHHSVLPGHALHLPLLKYVDSRALSTSTDMAIKLPHEEIK
jgi:hypothetical protein